MYNPSEEMQLYFSRVRPMCRELFGMACVICGDYEAAEYALQRAILDGWNARTGRTGAAFREDLRELLRLSAVQEAQKPENGTAEAAEDCFAHDALPDALDDEPQRTPDEALLLQEIQRESPEFRRLLALVHGCGLKPAEAARMIGMNAKQAQGRLERFAANARRKLPQRQRRQLEALTERLAREELLRIGASLPDPGTIYRRFEAEASQVHRSPRRWLSHAVNAVIVVVLAVLCTFLFWLVAVLIQAPAEPVPGEAPAAMENL